MTYSPQKERELLALLVASSDPLGVPFSWAGSHHEEDHVADEVTEYHLDQMEEAGLVRRKLATKDGANFLATVKGCEKYEADTNLNHGRKWSWSWHRVVAQKKSAWGWLVALAIAIWFLFNNVLSPSWTCPYFPEFAHSMLDRCAQLHTGDNP
ncbi:hypothetical protein J4E08_07610 [Sagittula sp. NFXS13]|uniref:hypothetical protein n=1 Tax=Sagittula sp. NFXS13 TaxID=2819095 RepID=UPI0032DF64D9